jgi:hypothetical protein
MGEVGVIHWTDDTGYQWTGGLVKPVGYRKDTRYPLVIQTHGFDADSFLTDGGFPTASAARAFASAGIMVLQMDHSRIEDIDTEREALDNVAGFKTAIKQLSSEGLIDPQRVGIIGFSRTCWYVQTALTSSDIPLVAVTLADGVDFSYMQYMLFGPGSPQFAREFNKVLGGPPFGEGLNRWVRLAPSFHMGSTSAAVRIEAITPSSLLSEWEIYSSLMLQGRPVDLIYFPQGQHILQTPRARLASQQGNVDWYRFWLQGYEDPDPAKASEYQRWGRMKGAGRL